MSRVLGLKQRLEREIAKVGKRYVKVTVGKYYENSPFYGMSLFGSLTTFPNMFISKDEYEEYGNSYF